MSTPTHIPASAKDHPPTPPYPSSTSSPSPSTQPSFPPTLISPTVLSALPSSYTIRPLQRADYAAGLLDVLRVLTTVGEISEKAWDTEYDERLKVVDTYYTLVVCDGAGKVVGTGTLVCERKFIHNLGRVGHIEDIAVAKDQQGKKLGLHIIHALDHIGERIGCYKTILDCSEANEGFYVKCGYKRVGLEMAHYHQ